MRQETRTLYTPLELKAAHPDAYARVLARWRELSEQSETPWARETIASLRAVIDACGAKLEKYSIGTDSGFVHVEAENESADEHDEYVPKDARWLLENVLKPNGYVDDKGAASFPGLCKWTGYCADDSMLQSVWQAMFNGSSLTEALEGLADVASKMMADDAEQEASEETMEANWADNEYDENGNEV